MFDQLLNVFGQSPQGQRAYTALQAQGYTPQQSAGILTTAFPAAAQAMQNALRGQGQGGQQGPGLLDIGSSNYMQNFLTGAVSGLLRGEGFKGAAVDGVQSVVGGHVATVIAARCGLPQRVAGVVGAIITPMMVDFLWDKFQTMNAGGAAAAAPSLAQGFGAMFNPPR